MSGAPILMFIDGSIEFISNLSDLLKSIEFEYQFTSKSYKNTTELLDCVFIAKLLVFTCMIYICYFFLYDMSFRFTQRVC